MAGVTKPRGHSAFLLLSGSPLLTLLVSSRRVLDCLCRPENLVLLAQNYRLCATHHTSLESGLCREVASVVTQSARLTCTARRSAGSADSAFLLTIVGVGVLSFSIEPLVCSNGWLRRARCAVAPARCRRPRPCQLAGIAPTASVRVPANRPVCRDVRAMLTPPQMARPVDVGV